MRSVDWPDSGERGADSLKRILLALLLTGGVAVLAACGSDAVEDATEPAAPAAGPAAMEVAAEPVVEPGAAQAADEADEADTEEADEAADDGAADEPDDAAEADKAVEDDGPMGDDSDDGDDADESDDDGEDDADDDGADDDGAGDDDGAMDSTGSEWADGWALVVKARVDTVMRFQRLQVVSESHVGGYELRVWRRFRDSFVDGDGPMSLTVGETSVLPDVPGAADLNAAAVVYMEHMYAIFVTFLQYLETGEQEYWDEYQRLMPEDDALWAELKADAAAYIATLG